MGLLFSNLSKIQKTKMIYKPAIWQKIQFVGHNKLSTYRLRAYHVSFRHGQMVIWFCEYSEDEGIDVNIKFHSTVFN